MKITCRIQKEFAADLFEQSLTQSFLILGEPNYSTAGPQGFTTV